MDQRITAKDGKLEKRRLVQSAAEKLRELILERPPGAQIGSLSEVGALLGVGVVTVQQAARVLEHEGLLAVRRGPGGGYYGTRPDEAALERALASYMRVHGASFEEVTEMMSLINCDIIPSAARCTDEGLRDEVRGLRQRVETCDSDEVRVAFEKDFQALLFKMNTRPFVEFLMRVGLSVYSEPPTPRIFGGEEEGVTLWKAFKRRILDAILARDEDLARFEAERYRKELQTRLRRNEASA